ncbi:RNA recognition motif 2 in serine/arginine-rich splicing factor 1 (SRSF1)-like protein [Ceratobasidium theobromae]|uniref:RNA recognition motif 2 in serine/arginine-rich splicing factor 1 (SRSF1)-like protein n=1 Tax=Ceratobasidium theobromae TaxID=1582974 RepID=A0A5N5QXD0_9AGAM|nr:RNA recognition motif 2 in serine/arginine-rich splicing factor 1 (SRSF1)-like protein [Ceratobasidium theobromae]
MFLTNNTCDPSDEIQIVNEREPALKASLQWSVRARVKCLPSDTRPEDVQKFFDGYGKIVDCRVMSGFGFVEFENSRDAEDIVTNFNGKAFLGQNIIVEFAKENRRRDNYDDRGPPLRSRRPAGFRVLVTGLSRDTSWQDLKDFAREAGSVSFADVDRDSPNTGIIEYVSQSDAENAVRTLDGRDLRGAPVRVATDERENSSGGGGGGGSGRNRDRDRDHYRRDRSRSPRRDYDRRDYRDREYRDDSSRRDYRDDRRDHRDDRREYRERRDDYRRSPRREDRELDKYAIYVARLAPFTYLVGL